MNDQMRLSEAQTFAEDVPARTSMGRAARTIVSQSEQINRFRRALRAADKEAHWAGADRHLLDYEEPDWDYVYDLQPGDMDSHN